MLRQLAPIVSLYKSSVSIEFIVPIFNHFKEPFFMQQLSTHYHFKKESPEILRNVNLDHFTLFKKL